MNFIISAIGPLPNRGILKFVIEMLELIWLEVEGKMHNKYHEQT